MDYDVSCKVVTIGDAAVGKTSFLKRFVTGWSYSLEERRHTIGVDYFTRVVPYPRGQIKYALYDTAGQERYRSITRMYAKGTAVCLFMFALNDASSFHRLKDWHSFIMTQNDPPAFSILVGTKSDLPGRTVTTQMASDLASTLHCVCFLETTVVSSPSVDHVFDVVHRHVEDLVMRSHPDTFPFRLAQGIYIRAKGMGDAVDDSGLEQTTRCGC